MAEKQKIAKSHIPPLKRGEVYLVNFDPTIGSEIKKTRPALIIQNDTANRYSSVTIVAAITSFTDKDTTVYPTEVFVPANEGGLENNSLVLLNQIRTVDKARLIKKIGLLHKDTMAHIENALCVSLDIGL